MTLSEFKAWFAGYAEEMDGPPTPKQWEKIKERVGKIDGTPITARFIADAIGKHIDTLNVKRKGAA